jgi:hypothetical protein
MTRSVIVPSFSSRDTMLNFSESGSVVRPQQCKREIRG